MPDALALAGVDQVADDGRDIEANHQLTPLSRDEGNTSSKEATVLVKAEKSGYKKLTRGRWAWKNPCHVGPCGFCVFMFCGIVVMLIAFTVILFLVAVTVPIKPLLVFLEPHKPFMP
eukprot:TRINITY_DN3748_c0_g1_i2.p1 TRINITY_DN3748_c0_g1~~TRINITY_DN3748_c0_g1_i2.p1  ORF type:complete len:117 (-),score=22.31 TRINITY_DN3748_c0_g1_i2:619-969(-)